MKNFIFGLSAGTLIMGFYLWVQSSPTPNTETVAASLPAEAIKTVSKEEMPKPMMKIVGKKVQVEEKSIRGVLTPLKKRRIAPIAKKPRKLKLKVSGLLLAHLENQRDQLAEQVSAHRGDMGWRIEFKTPTSLISSLGLKDGDLIHYSSLESQDLNDVQVNTMDRLKALLRYIED